MLNFICNGISNLIETIQRQISVLDRVKENDTQDNHKL